MSYYVEKQYSGELSENAKKDLKIFFFDSFFKGSKRILDVACSVGRVISIDPGRIEGIDIDKDAVEIAKSKGLRIKVGNISKKIPYKSSGFDGIYCSQIIEHLEDPKRFLMEIKRLLRKRGRAAIITPDYLIASRKKNGNFWDDYTHIRPFTKTALKRVAIDAGFNNFIIYNFPPLGFRHLVRWGVLPKKLWVKLSQSAIVPKGRDLVMEIIKDEKI